MFHLYSPVVLLLFPVRIAVFLSSVTVSGIFSGRACWILWFFIFITVLSAVFLTVFCIVSHWFGCFILILRHFNTSCLIQCFWLQVYYVFLCIDYSTDLEFLKIVSFAIFYSFKQNCIMSCSGCLSCLFLRETFSFGFSPEVGDTFQIFTFFTTESHEIPEYGNFSRRYEFLYCFFPLSVL